MKGIRQIPQPTVSACWDQYLKLNFTTFRAPLLCTYPTTLTLRRNILHQIEELILNEQEGRILCSSLQIKLWSSHRKCALSNPNLAWTWGTHVESLLCQGTSSNSSSTIAYATKCDRTSNSAWLLRSSTFSYSWRIARGKMPSSSSNNDHNPE